MKKHTFGKERISKDLKNRVEVKFAWNDEKDTTQVVGLDSLPEFMLKRLAEDVFDRLPKSKIKVWFL